MSADNVECRGVLRSESDLAIFVSKNEATVFGYWIPRSMLTRLSKTGPIAPATLPSVIFKLPEWLVEKKQCWELVP